MNKLLLGTCCLLVLIVLVAPGLRRAKAISATEPAVGNTPFAVADEITERQMALQSELILSGQCLGTRTAWMGRTLVTLATISVGEVIKGQPAETVTVALPGG